MNKDIIDFYYFSGTGNTLLVVKKMKETFEKEGININLHKIEDFDPKNIYLNHIIGIAFPVAIFSTYSFVWDFIHKLPQAKGTKIFMVDTLGGFSGGIIGPVKKIVKNKGYNPIGACEIQMPSNIFFIQDKETNDSKVKKGLIIAEKYALDIINETANWGRIPVFSDAMNLFSIGTLKLTGINLHQKLFLFDPDKQKCSKCDICLKICPVKNIKLDNDQYPKHGLNCQYCLRCVSFCPKGAIPAKFNYKGKTYSACKAKEFL